MIFLFIYAATLKKDQTSINAELVLSHVRLGNSNGCCQATRTARTQAGSHYQAALPAQLDHALAAPPAASLQLDWLTLQVVPRRDDA
jgi:hypothetical protein